MEEKTYTVIELAETLGVARTTVNEWSEDAASTPNRRSPC